MQRICADSYSMNSLGIAHAGQGGKDCQCSAVHRSTAYYTTEHNANKVLKEDTKTRLRNGKKKKRREYWALL